MTYAMSDVRTNGARSLMGKMEGKRGDLNVFGLNPLEIYMREVRTSLYLQNYNSRVHHLSVITESLLLVCQD